MSQSEVERFARDLKSDGTLMSDLAGSPDKSLAAAVSVGARRGYSFTLDDAKAFVAARAKASGKELSENDLDKVAGAGGPTFCAAQQCLANKPTAPARNGP